MTVIDRFVIYFHMDLRRALLVGGAPGVIYVNALRNENRLNFPVQQRFDLITEASSTV